MKLIRIDGHDKIKGTIVNLIGKVEAEVVSSIHWEGAYQFTFVTNWRAEAINVHLIKEPTQSGSLQIKVDGLYVEHTLHYEDVVRGYDWFRMKLYKIIKRYYKES